MPDNTKYELDKTRLEIYLKRIIRHASRLIGMEMTTYEYEEAVREILKDYRTEIREGCDAL
jgi:hypothetical protein